MTMPRIAASDAFAYILSSFFSARLINLWDLLLKSHCSLCFLVKELFLLFLGQIFRFEHHTNHSITTYGNEDKGQGVSEATRITTCFSPGFYVPGLFLRPLAYGKAAARRAARDALAYIGLASCYVN